MLACGFFALYCAAYLFSSFSCAHSDIPSPRVVCGVYWGVWFVGACYISLFLIIILGNPANFGLVY